MISVICSKTAFDKEDTYCPLERQIELFQLVNKVFDNTFVFSSHDEARKYFLHLQNQIKNMNFLPFNDNYYKNALAAIESMIDKGK